MVTVKVQGHGIVAEYDGNRLCFAPREGEQPVIIPVEQITEVALKSASMLAYGRLVVLTRDGQAFTARFRRGQQREWVGLQSLLGI